jgi:hypothetical protein
MWPERPQDKTRKGGPHKGESLSKIVKKRGDDGRNRIPEHERCIPVSKSGEMGGKRPDIREKIFVSQAVEPLFRLGLGIGIGNKRWIGHLKI